MFDVAVLGGSGKEGRGLVSRWLLRGTSVVIGSRDPQRARSQLSGEAGLDCPVETFREAASLAKTVVLSVPYTAKRDVLEDIAPLLGDRLVIDITVPLVPPKVMRVQMPAAGSSAIETAGQLPGVRLAAALHNVSAEKLRDPQASVDCDSLVFADDDTVRAEAVAVIQAAGIDAIEGGPLCNAAAAEALTSVLIWINRRYRVPGAGVRITGLSSNADHAV